MTQPTKFVDKYTQQSRTTITMLTVQAICMVIVIITSALSQIGFWPIQIFFNAIALVLTAIAIYQALHYRSPNGFADGAVIALTAQLIPAVILFLYFTPFLLLFLGAAAGQGYDIDMDGAMAQWVTWLLTSAASLFGIIAWGISISTVVYIKRVLRAARKAAQPIMYVPVYPVVPVVPVTPPTSTTQTPPATPTTQTQSHK